MKKFLLITLFILGLGSHPAQSFVRQFKTLPNFDLQSVQNTDTLKILAVMVEFQADKYDGTTGTGKFGSHYTQEYGDTILDPLPHDANYFADHLEFARNYFNKVSRGKVKLGYYVLPNVITISKTMREYSPGYNSNNRTPVGNFVQEVWQLADQKNPNFNFSEYDLFIIFHAGISSSFSDGAPLINRNMPSYYLSNLSLKEIFGNQFNGIPVNNGSFLINNTIIMPETESREATAIDDSLILIELSINGLLVGNIASHFGLPDLFNTETSITAIGRFGLMDGQALLANSGMFPPEPSPWEKIFLGWETPSLLGIGNEKVNISTRISASAGDTTLLKIRVNSNEYFLVENRSQDSNKDKVKITYKRSGQVYTKVIEPDTSGIFIFERKFGNGIPGGVVIDVDEFDAALPGNGIVIWHIDEKVINEKISENKINADIDRRGVFVLEADGIQDIGQVFSSIFGNFFPDGSQEDFWYKGNQARLFKNRFSYDTKPSSRSNDGSNSLITLENFSDLSNKISFNVIYGSNDITLSKKVNIPTLMDPSAIASLQLGDKYFVYILDGSDLLRISVNDEINTIIKNFSSFNPAVFKNGNDEFVVGAKGNTLNLATTLSDKFETAHHIFNAEITSTPLIISFVGVVKTLFGTSDGKVYEIDLVEFVSSQHSRGIKNYSLDNKAIKQMAACDDYFSVITENTFIDSRGKFLTFNQKTKRLALAKNLNGKFVNIVLTEGSNFHIIIDGQVVSSFNLPINDISVFSVADLSDDGNNYILFNSLSNVYAVSFTGIIADNFPISVETSSSLIGVPLVLDLGNNGQVEIISFTSSGDVYAFNSSDGKLISPYPIASGSNANSIPVLISEELPTMGPIARFRPVLPIVNNSGNLNLWSLASIQGKVYWISEYGTFSNTSFTGQPDIKNQITEYFPIEKAYNWPNPVYGNETNIRYFVTEDSEVSIKIFDLSGDLVANMNNKATGGFDNETKWNVSGIQSGIYYARIEVKSGTGKSASKLIKIAVIK